MPGILIPLVLLILVGGFTATFCGAEGKIDNAGTGQFDERRLFVRGKGCKLGFFVMLVVEFAFFEAELILGRQLIRTGNALLITGCFGVGAMGVYCVIRDAYIGLRGSADANVVSMAILFAIALFCGIDQATEKGLFTDGLLGVCWVYFAVTLMGGVMRVTMLVKMLLARRDRE